MSRQPLQGWRDLAEANRITMDLVWDAARRQQEFAFVMARTALSGMPGATGQAGHFWCRAAVAYGQACSHGLDAMRILLGAGFGAERAGRAPQA